MHQIRNRENDMSNNADYFPRLSDIELQKALDSSGAVLIEGAKWCGKTRMASNASKSALYMQDPDNTVSCLNRYVCVICVFMHR